MYQPGSSAVVERSIRTGHFISFEDAMVFAGTVGCLDCLVGDHGDPATSQHLHQRRDMDLTLIVSQSWNPASYQNNLWRSRVIRNQWMEWQLSSRIVRAGKRRVCDDGSTSLNSRCWSSFIQGPWFPIFNAAINTSGKRVTHRISSDDGETVSRISYINSFLTWPVACVDFVLWCCS
jgi:hypothetical protein